MIMKNDNFCIISTQVWESIWIFMIIKKGLVFYYYSDNFFLNLLTLW